LSCQFLGEAVANRRHFYGTGVVEVVDGHHNRREILDTPVQETQEYLRPCG
jgi:hypothetical protein